MRRYKRIILEFMKSLAVISTILLVLSLWLLRPDVRQARVNPSDSSNYPANIALLNFPLAVPAKEKKPVVSVFNHSQKFAFSTYVYPFEIRKVVTFSN